MTSHKNTKEEQRGAGTLPSLFYGTKSSSHHVGKAASEEFKELSSKSMVVYCPKEITKCSLNLRRETRHMR